MTRVILNAKRVNNQLSTQQALSSKDGKTRKNGVRTTKERKIFTAIITKKLTNKNIKQLLNDNEIDSERESVSFFKFNDDNNEIEFQVVLLADNDKHPNLYQEPDTFDAVEGNGR